MIGRICSIFPGHTLLGCLDLTREQIRSLYGESFRQEARRKLRDIHILMLVKSAKKYIDTTLSSLKIQAFPPDEEEDGELSKTKITAAKEKLQQLLGVDQVK